MQMFLGKKKNGKLLEEVLLGTPLETAEVSIVLIPQVLDDPRHLPLGCTRSEVEELLPAPCSGDKIPGKSMHGSLCSLKFSFWNEIWPTHTQCSRFLQNPTGFAKIRTSFHIPYSHSFYLQPNFYPFIPKGEHSFARAFFFFPSEASLCLKSPKSLTQCAPPGIQSLSHWVTSCQGGHIITKGVFISSCRQNTGNCHEMCIIQRGFVDG